MSLSIILSISFNKGSSTAPFKLSILPWLSERLTNSIHTGMNTLYVVFRIFAGIGSSGAHLIPCLRMIDVISSSFVGSNWTSGSPTKVLFASPDCPHDGGNELRIVSIFSLNYFTNWLASSTGDVCSGNTHSFFRSSSLLTQLRHIQMWLFRVYM